MLIPPARYLKEVLGEYGLEARLCRSVADGLVEGDDVVHAGSVGQVEDPAVRGIAQTRPIEAAWVVHVAYHPDVHRYLGGPYGPVY
jgi:hypothetical protein